MKKKTLEPRTCSCGVLVWGRRRRCAVCAGGGKAVPRSKVRPRSKLKRPLPEPVWTSEDTRPGPKAIGYVRTSTKRQILSLTTQPDAIRELCAGENLNLVAIYQDRGRSGALPIRRRPALEAALAQLRPGDSLVVHYWDRLVRATSVSRDVRRAVEAVGASIRVVANSRLTLNMLMVMSQWERETISERTAKVLKHLLALGVHVGRPKFGYEYSDELDERGHRIVKPLPRELKTLDAMIRLRSIGHTLREVATLLNLGGHKTKRDGEWHAATVGKILKRVTERAGAA